MKILLIFLVLSLFISCQPSDKYVYECTYVVYYSITDRDTVTIVSENPMKLGSNRGTNYIIYNNFTETSIISTSAPIKILKNIKKQIK